MREKGAFIEKIEPGSIAEEIGLEPGDQLLAINGKPIMDILDYRFMMADDYLDLDVEKANGENWLVEIEKEAGESLGAELDGIVFDGIRPCINQCVFCFVDQLPAGMRETLYTKDDDYRLSFLTGSFITLTNLGKRDWDKLAEMRISPLYVSVHAADPKVRAYMLGSKRAGDIGRDLARLRDFGIETHTQIVLCPDVNDGEVLTETVAFLRSFWPAVRSVGIVPLGVTCHRAGLPELREVTRHDARQMIALADQWQQRFRQEIGVGFVYAADEFYIKAHQPFPVAAYYDDYAQLENGIGMARLFIDRYRSLLSRRKNIVMADCPVVVCGQSARSLFEEIQALSAGRNIAFDIEAVPNRFFGEKVTVTGLLTGRDIIAALGTRRRGRRVLLPSVLLKAGERVLLDDITIDEVANATGASVQVTDTTADAFLRALLKKNTVKKGGQAKCPDPS